MYSLILVVTYRACEQAGNELIKRQSIKEIYTRRVCLDNICRRIELNAN